MKYISNNIIFFIYPAFVSLLAALILFWLFYPSPAEAGLIVENRNSASVVNEVNAVSSSGGGQSRSESRVYTEVNGEVIRDEVFTEESADGQAQISIKQEIKVENGIVEEKFNISGLSSPSAPGERGSADTTEPERDLPADQPAFHFPVALDLDQTGDGADPDTDQAETEPIAASASMDESGQSSEETVEAASGRMAWWQAFWDKIQSWWNNVFSYLV